MTCAAGATKPCYSGPMGTEGVGICKGGTATCKNDGSGYGACEGEMTPAPADDCAMKVDANCDGTTCGQASWSYDFQGPNTQVVGGITTDASGNIYLAGKVGGSITFGTNTLVSAGGFDAFIVKLDSTGAFVWGNSFGDAPNNQVATSVAVDGGGNVVVAGWFFGSMTIGNKILTAGGTNFDAFIAKFDATGNALWAFSYGDVANAQAVNSVAIDSHGDVLATGYFAGSIDFGKGNMIPVGVSDIFVAKLAGDTGVGLWSKQTGTAGSSSSGNSVAVDNGGSAVIAGTSYGAFVERLDGAGNQAWAMQLGDYKSSAAAVAMDAAGNAYVTGTSKVIAATGPTFVTKLDVLGNQQWAVGAGASGPVAIATDASGDSFVAGALNTSADFGGGTLTGPAFLWKLNPDGTHAWSRVYGMGTGTSFTAAEFCGAVAVSSPKDVIVACENYFTMDFGASTGPVKGSPPEGGFNSLNITLAKIAVR